jgi:ankyrin repeat protein
VSISALCESIKKNRVEVAKRLLDSGLSVLGTDEHGNTLAHVAAAAGNIEILRLLHDRGAPLDRLNWIHQTPLSLAARNGHLEGVKYLCENGATTHGLDLNTAPLAAAAAAGHLEIVKYLVEQRHVPLNALERPFGATPLFVAARFSRLDVVRYLMEKGADPTIANAQGETATGRVKEIMEGQPSAPTSAAGTPHNKLLASRGAPSVKAQRTSPPSGARKETQSLLSHLIKPRKEWHFWQR